MEQTRIVRELRVSKRPIPPHVPTTITAHLDHHTGAALERGADRVHDATTFRRTIAWHYIDV
jgi:hypothetical protein